MPGLEHDRVRVRPYYKLCARPTFSVQSATHRNAPPAFLAWEHFYRRRLKKLHIIYFNFQLTHLGFRPTQAAGLEVLESDRRVQVPT